MNGNPSAPDRFVAAPPAPDPRLRRPVRVAPPPRAISLGALLRVLLGHEAPVIVLVVFLGSTFFGWLFLANSEAATALELRGPLRETTGEVTRVSETFASENKRARIWRVEFEYEIRGETFRQSSYSVGEPKLRPGDEVEIEYARARPARARVVGLRGRLFGEGVAVLLILPALCLLAWPFALIPGVRRLAMLRRGRLAWGRLVARDVLRAKPSAAPNGYALTYEYDDPDDASLRLRTAPQRRRSSVEVSLGEERAIVDEPEEPLLCLQRGSSTPVMLLDALPRGMRLDERGEIAGGFGWPALVYAAVLIDLAAIALFVSDLLGV